LCDKGDIPQRPVFHEDKVIAQPHPSGANAESIALLLAELLHRLTTIKIKCIVAILKSTKLETKNPLKAKYNIKKHAKQDGKPSP